MESAGIEGLSDEEALRRIGELVDCSWDVASAEGNTRALDWADALQARGVSNETAADLDYCRSNAWANRAALKRGDRAWAWSWDQQETAQQILLLRRALNNAAFGALPWTRQCQILTNLGNQLNTAGRFVEALEYWSRALLINSTFWMARGNRGYALMHYAKALYDPGHSIVLLMSAHRDMIETLSSATTHPDFGHLEALKGFVECKEAIESWIDVPKASSAVSLDGHDLGKTREEQRYRRWCLENRLFLNPLNDVGPHAIAARDILSLPTFTVALEEPPSLLGFFNQMKQEFTSARWLYYDGVVSSGRTHFSDRDVLLCNTLDYPAYGLAIEKIKISMRTAYSLFDKTAFFLNSYLNLGMKPGRASFRDVWRGGSKKSGAPLLPAFEESENWPLRGLYWLSKDLLEEGFQNGTEPDGRELHKLRNHLEHKYLKVHEFVFPIPTDKNSSAAWVTDDLAYSISRVEFQAKALRVLKLARATLMYLSLGMHREERRRAAQRKEEDVIAMPMGAWDDDWKR